VPTATDGGVPDGTDGGPDGGGDTGPGDADATTGTDADVGGSGDGTVADTSNDPDGGTISDADSGPADGGSTDSGRDGAPTAPGEWTLVKAGTFHMGSPDTELGRSKNEPLHQVTLTRNFWIMTTEVTQEQFADTMGYGPSSFTSCGVTCPVETASWHEFAAYANALSLAAGLGQCYECTGTAPSFSCLLNSSYDSPYDCPGYRLPTEAEWEYAARAGTTTATYGGDLDVTQCDASAVLGPLAWFCANSRSRTHPAGQKMANPWRLADMLGNVAEWCHDGDGALPTTPVTDPVGPESSRFRVIRGGNWDEFAKVLRAASRSSISPNRGNSTTGGRLAMSVP
jgi:formylglycine-generating enzyme required for sulfatase activity